MVTTGAGRGTRQALVGAAILAGIVGRVLVYRAGLAPADADEALAGLMAKHLLTGEHRTFLWGQDYGGTPVLYLMAPLVRVLGASLVSLRFWAVLLSAVNPVLLWLVARRFLAAEAAVHAALLLWLWPATAVWLPLREFLFYTPTLTIGLAAWLVLLPSDGRDAPRWAWPAAGLLLGLGWWMSPNIAYFAAPLGLWATASGTLRRQWRWAVLAVPATALGAAPWLRFNLSHGGASMRLPPLAVASPPGQNLRFLAETGLPGLLGLREPYTAAWLGGWAWVLYPPALGVLAWATVLGVRRLGLDALALLCFPVLYAVQPYGTVYTNGRYLFFLAPTLCLLVARVVPTIRWRLVATVALAGLTVLDLRAMHGQTVRPTGPLVIANVPDPGPASVALRTHGLTRGYGGYWAAFLVTYDSDEAAIVAPTSFNDRYPPYTAAVQADDRPFWLLPAGWPNDDAFVRDLDRLGVGARRIDAGGWHIYVTDRAVRPEELSPEATY